MAGAPLGSKNAAKSRLFYDALCKQLVQNPEKLDKVTDVLITAATNGEAWAVKELIDRMDGKAIQAQEITGADGAPLLTGIEVTFVKPSE